MSRLPLTRPSWNFTRESNHRLEQIFRLVLKMNKEKNTLSDWQPALPECKYRDFAVREMPDIIILWITIAAVFFFVFWFFFWFQVFFCCCFYFLFCLFVFLCSVLKSTLARAGMTLCYQSVCEGNLRGILFQTGKYIFFSKICIFAGRSSFGNSQS